MKYDLNQLIFQPKLPLAHRIRAPRSGILAGSPCLILLHGVGSNELSMTDFALQQSPDMTVILVRSPIVLGAMQFGFFQVSFTATGPSINPEQAEQSRKLLGEFIEALPGAYGIDPRQVWVAGFSQGGILSASIALTRPELVSGFGILSGRILPEIGPFMAAPAELSSVHAFVSHGVDDNKLTVEFARSSRQLLAANNVANTYREYSAGHELNSAMRRDFSDWLALELKVSGTAL